MRPEPKTSAFEPQSADKEAGMRGAALDQVCIQFADFPDSVLVVDGNLDVVFLNRSAERLFGLDLRRNGPVSCSEILQFENGGPERDLVRSCIESGNLDQVPVRVRNGSGEWLRRYVSASLVKGRGGGVEGLFAILRDIDIDVKVESQLRNEVTVLNSILRNFPIPFFIVDTSLVITYMNEHLESLTGFSREEVINKLHCFEVLSTPCCNTPSCMLKQVMETRQPLAGLRHTIRNREGKIVPVVVYSSILTDLQQNVIGGFEAIRDISPVIEAERKIQLLTEMTQEGILMVDLDYRVVYANSRMGEIYERSREELLGMDVRELLPPHHVEVMEELMSKADQKHHMRFCSPIRPEKDVENRLATFETCMASVPVSSGVLTLFYFRDLTSRIETERELRKANSFLNNIIRSSVNGIVVLDTEGTVLIFNEGAERILGYKSHEVVGRPGFFKRFYKPEVAREVMRRMRSSEYGPEGKLLASRVSFIRKDGQSVPVSLSAALIKEGDREIGSVGIFSDLTEQDKIRKELHEARIQLLQAEKIASLGRLSAGVAHEINNPLAGILIYADLLMQEIGSNAQWKEDLEEIIHQTLRCKQIVNRLLEFSRQPLGQRIPFDVNNVVERCLELLGRQTLFHNIELVLDLQPDLPHIHGDPGQMQQVLTNLIINAASAMDGMGRIGIASGFSEDSGMVLLTVADTGPGIPEEIRDKIFEPFFTTKRPGEGTGLGLSVVYGVIQQHGGTIKVHDAPEGGAVFVISLPLEPPEVQCGIIEDG